MHGLPCLPLDRNLILTAFYNVERKFAQANGVGFLGPIGSGSNLGGYTDEII